ncbi:protein kinase [Roseiconus nitratireducens]|uniref:Protein kinase n=1 Tax=Roseiconus nitratireducens TaxID=2605748 RepID=A0A5M6DHE7_9BACT|nr:protein kinase [Roseiconus nitratireducens]KAA5546968.1 protein kinase [Roseiconus nitratireducens]
MNVDEIAMEALSLDDPDRREAFLTEACDGDQRLRQKVESLLAALEQTEDGPFLASGLFGSSDQPSASSTASNASGGGSERFEIRSRHALGGLGEVWVAFDRQLGREVALKQIRPEWARNTDATARFRREAEITGFLEHPGVVPIYSLGQSEDGRPYYAMQFIRGRTLEQVVTDHLVGHASNPNRHGWYDNATLRAILDDFVDVCQTIDYAHSRGVVHRDLKPANIMLGRYGQTLVVDWGLAKILDQPEDQSDAAEPGTIAPASAPAARKDFGQTPPDNATRHGAAMGTPRFMSPEQAAGKTDQIRPATDIYCLGATLYYALTGQPPHVGQNDLSSTLERITTGRFPPPSTVRSQVPKPLQAIVLKAMATDPLHRYASAGQLADDVKRYLADEPISVFRDRLPKRISRWTRKHPALSAAALVGLLLTFAGTVAGLSIRQEMARREAIALHRQRDSENRLQIQREARRLKAVAATDAASVRADAAIAENRYADAAELIRVAIDQSADQPSLTDRRERWTAQHERIARLGKFNSLRQAGQDLDFLGRDTEAAVLLQQSLDELGFWQSDTWWDELPDDDLSPQQRDRLRWDVYRVLTSLNSLYLTRMVKVMGGESDSGAPSPLRLIRSYLATDAGTREARATLELTRRIQSFRPSEAADWLGSIAAFRVREGERVSAGELGPPQNAADGVALAVYSLIASVDSNYRSWFDGYGKTFLALDDDDPQQRCLRVARETLRRVSDDAADDFWLRLTLGQTYFLIAQHAERNNQIASAIENYELSRAEYGRCIAIRPDAPFGFADRSTVALRQAVLLRDHAGATEHDRARAAELLRLSQRDANQAQRISPSSPWVYWHVGATAAERGMSATATEALLTAAELGFDVGADLDAPMVRLDDVRGRAAGLLFARTAAESLPPFNPSAPDTDADSARQAVLVAALEMSRGEIDPARQWSLRAIQYDSDNSRAHRIAGWCHYRAQQWNDAEEHFQRAIAIDPADAIALIGAAQLADRTDAGSMEQADRWYQSAIRTAKSDRQRAIAYLGLAQHALRRGDLNQALSLIQAARQLDAACDLSHFSQLGRDEAKRLLLKSKSTPSAQEREQIMETILALRDFMQQIASLPIASVTQILETSSERPPQHLPLLCGGFELPVETYWQMEISRPEAGDAAIPAGFQTPFQRTGTDSHSGQFCLSIRSGRVGKESTRWRLEQRIPAQAGHTYQLSGVANIVGKQTPAVTLRVLNAEGELASVIPTSSTTWQPFTVHFEVPSGSPAFTDLTVEIQVSGEVAGKILLDDLRISLVQ